MAKAADKKLSVVERQAAATSKTKNSALKKATQILELVAAEEFGISAAEIALRLNLPRQTAHRTVRALEDMGLLIRALAHDKYETGPALVKLATTILITSHRRGPWRAILKQVVERTNESCNVAVLDGYEIIYVDRVECEAPLRVQLEVGSRVPAYCTAIGKVLLAYLPTATRKKLLDVIPVKKLTKTTITYRRALEAELQKVRKQGYAVNNEEFITGIDAIAVPIYDDHGVVVAGVAIHAPSLRVSATAMTGFLPILRDAAKRLSALRHPDSAAGRRNAPERRPPVKRQSAAGRSALRVARFATRPKLI